MSASEHGLVAATDAVDGAAINEVPTLLALFFCGVIGWSISRWVLWRFGCFEASMVDKFTDADMESDETGTDEKSRGGAPLESEIRKRVCAEQTRGCESRQVQDRTMRRQSLRKRAGVVDENDCLSALSAHVDALLDDALEAEADRETFRAFC
eukprot:TRINITY_DN6751_c0_g3_i1.p1 TRINITY_DN6751_c0_g3~~TRINITY_DN6751_c0_g3_i1.p1  ORF type:complete len:153 (-),score=31.09 TRINITY_DN6751_c0_g3_i1:335-793(-)